MPSGPKIGTYARHAPSPKPHRQARKFRACAKGWLIPPTRDRGQAGVRIVRNEVDMACRLGMRDTRIDLMGAMHLRLRSASARRSALLFRGPYGAASGWRKVRRMARRDAGQFFAGTGVPSKNPGTR